DSPSLFEALPGLSGQPSRQHRGRVASSREGTYGLRGPHVVRPPQDDGHGSTRGRCPHYFSAGSVGSASSAGASRVRRASAASGSKKRSASASSSAASSRSTVT